MSLEVILHGKGKREICVILEQPFVNTFCYEDNLIAIDFFNAMIIKQGYASHK